MFTPRRIFAAASIALILLMTLSRFGPGILGRLVGAMGGSVDGWQVAIALNVLLFVPLGMVIGWTRRPYLLLAAPLLSIAIEVTQLLLPTRSATLIDVVANTSGAVVGFLLMRLWAHAVRSAEPSLADGSASEPSGTDGRTRWPCLPEGADRPTSSGPS
jgi:hypothetical protein